MPEVRVRFAPSPTGAPHVGNLRTALFNWLWARHSGGKFILRVEDTDQAREVDNGLELILESLDFLGLDWDEGPDIGGPFGPYRQSERLPIYRKYAEELIAAGQAYRCYCSPERLEEMRREQHARGETTRYDRRCRGLAAGERAQRESAGDSHVVRLAVPLEGETTLHDFIHGDVTISNKDVDDQVLLKSDGFPTYHLAVVVDDHLMEITHVMRADDWIPSFPKHILLFQAFGWEPPLIGHVPIVLGPDKKKLGKRHGSTSVLQFREEGYLPETMENFLALLGWAFDDRTELFSRSQLIQLFELEKINHSPAIFDRSKLDWMNGHYIRKLATEDLGRRLARYFDRLHVPYQTETLLQALPLIQDRIKTLHEAIGYTDFLFEPDLEYDPQLLLVGKLTVPQALAVIDSAERVLDQEGIYTSQEQIERELRGAAANLGLKPAQFFGVLRIAVTAKAVSPPLTGSIQILGRTMVSRRLARARLALQRH